MSEEIFAVDVSRCTGCGACAVACKDRADVPDEVCWLRVEEREAGACPATVVSYRVVHCFHCAQPPCVEVCPAGALVKTDTGLVALDAGACTACGECAPACPFAAIATAADGIPSKCDGCRDETTAGADPVCVRACPMQALAYVPEREAFALGGAGGRVRDGAFDDRGIVPAVVYLRRAAARPDGA